MAGEFTSVNGTNRNRFARLNADGNLDTSFNPGTGADATVRAIATQSGGKVFIAGDFVSVNGTNRNRVARLNSDGSVDTTFNPGTGANATVECIALQSDGKILLGGQFTSVNGTNRIHIARLNADGTLDTGFNPGAGADGFVLSVAVRADGKVFAAGDFFSFNGFVHRRIARLNADGSVDTAFNSGTGANDTVNSVAIQADGKALIGGFFNTINAIGRSGVARLEGDLPQPVLAAGRAAGAIVISWSAAFTNFILQTTTNASQPATWTNVLTAPALLGSQLVITNATSTVGSYFRLKSL